MATLTGKTPANTYKDLLQISNSNSGIDGTLRSVEDGEGTSGPLKLSSSAAEWAGTVNYADNVLQRPELKDYAETVVSANSGTSYDIDLESGNVFDITLTGNVTFTFSNPPASGKNGSFTLKLTQDGTGGRSVTWPASIRWPDAGTAPTLTTTASTYSKLIFETDDGGTNWDGNLVGDNYS